MTFTKAEKEIIKAIVKYGGEEGSLADAINRSHILEKRGWNIVVGDDNEYYLFYRNDRYNYEDEQMLRGYLAELLALLDKLYIERLLVAFPFSGNRPLVIGKENVTRYRFDINSVDNGREYIVLTKFGFGWYAKNKEPLYCWDKCTDMVRPLENQLFSAYHVSQDLRELVKHNFRTEEECRFRKQQLATWISIFVAIIIGLLGLFVSKV